MVASHNACRKYIQLTHVKETWNHKNKIANSIRWNIALKKYNIYSTLRCSFRALFAENCVQRQAEEKCLFVHCFCSNGQSKFQFKFSSSHSLILHTRSDIASKRLPFHLFSSRFLLMILIMSFHQTEKRYIDWYKNTHSNRILPLSFFLDFGTHRLKHFHMIDSDSYNKK